MSSSIKTSHVVKRQVVLPLSRAVEIAYKSIRLRLARSLLVTSGIILALAFLMSILTTDAIVNSLRDWASHPPAAAKLQAERLIARMHQRGVPTTSVDIANDRIQTRWLLGLALLVALAGILNAMLMSVTERFREIGTMKCLGALDGFIIKLFLLESVFQGAIGTAVGIVLGLLMSFAGAAINYGQEVWMHLPVRNLVNSILICLLVGLALTVAGAVYPAWRAARMQPIDAMRLET
jgi:predicted lysophospholipase L1 biosynthesis ABC-type transport system permease subunit